MELVFLQFIANRFSNFVLRDEVMEFFGGKEGFKKFHQQTINSKDNSIEE